MPDVMGITLNEARAILRENGLDYTLTESQTGEMIVVEQLPRRGIIINTNTTVILEAE